MAVSILGAVDSGSCVFTLLHPNALSIAQTIRNLYGPRVVLSLQPFDDDMLVGTRGMGIGVGGGGVATCWV